MRNGYFLILALALFFGCKTNKNIVDANKVVVTFGSCNKVELENIFWEDILAENPDVFIWGGDNVYADTDDVPKIANFYKRQDEIPGYAALKEKIFITGTWDDHDYGLNDGGEEFVSKVGSEQAYLDFMDVPKKSPRRNRKGVYSSELINKPGGQVKIINLDTRYFRTALTVDDRPGRRYKPNPPGEGTIFGRRAVEMVGARIN